MTEIRLVDAGKVRHLKEKSLKLMRSPLTFPYGAMVKTVLVELELWEETEKCPGADQSNPGH